MKYGVSVNNFDENGENAIAYLLNTEKVLCR